MTNDRNPEFRTRVRVKAASRPVTPGAGEAGQRPDGASPAGGQPRSLLEALRQAAPAPAIGPASEGGPSAAEPQRRPPASRPRKQETVGPAAPGAPRGPANAESGAGPHAGWRRPKSAAARQAAARLKQLERLKDSAVGLERLARGEIEEATVEIIRHEGPPARRSRRKP